MLSYSAQHTYVSTCTLSIYQKICHSNYIAIYVISGNSEDPEEEEEQKDYCTSGKRECDSTDLNIVTLLFVDKN